MRLRCNNPECRHVVNLSQNYIRHGDRLFCCEECVKQYTVQTRRFEQTTDKFSPTPPLNYKSKKWWE